MSDGKIELINTESPSTTDDDLHIMAIEHMEEHPRLNIHTPPRHMFPHDTLATSHYPDTSCVAALLEADTMGKKQHGMHNRMHYINKQPQRKGNISSSASQDNNDKITMTSMQIVVQIRILTKKTNHIKLIMRKSQISSTSSTMYLK